MLGVYRARLISLDTINSDTTPPIEYDQRIILIYENTARQNEILTVKRSLFITQTVLLPLTPNACHSYFAGDAFEQ